MHLLKSMCNKEKACVLVIENVHRLRSMCFVFWLEKYALFDQYIMS